MRCDNCGCTLFSCGCPDGPENALLEEPTQNEQSGDWRERVFPDPFDLEAGITREEIIANYEEAHADNTCDPMCCPICTDNG